MSNRLTSEVITKKLSIRKSKIKEKFANKTYMMNSKILLTQLDVKAP